jgi:hypothetical protein
MKTLLLIDENDASREPRWRASMSVRAIKWPMKRNILEGKRL